MLGDSATTTLSGDTASETAHRHDAVGSVSVSVSGTVAGEENSGEEDIRIGREEGERSFGGNRWPRQETLALLKIRSEMDVAFRDASVKGPLWEQVSRKLGELGYHRSAKKCKEKFENVYKYHKRTKDVRSGKPDSKTYKYFEQLEALDTHPPNSQPLPLPLPPPSFHSHPPKSAGPITIPPQTSVISSHIPSTVPSTTTALPHLMNISFSQPNPTIQLQQPPAVVSAAAPPLSNPANVISTPFQTNVSAMPTTTAVAAAAAVTFHNIEADLISNSTSSSSSTSSDEELEASRGRKRKRKWKDFFERLMREVIQKQEEMQRRFLEAIEKREHERVVREEAWRMQEMSKINKEREILAQERSMAAAKDAAITSFLQKITDGQHNNPSQQTRTPPPPPPPSQQQMDTPMPTQTPTPTPAPAPQPQTTPTPPSQPVSTLQILVPQKVGNNNNQMQIDHNGGENYNMSPAASSSRWPKVEVQALIQLRTNLEAKYQENGPKGPLWEEISSAMKKIGYNRNAKRCKEKWENINKYFKKVKESKKMRREDSKTCPYFDLLDAIHKEKINKVDNNMIGSSRPLLLQQQHQQQQPLMVRPEQQWPPQQEITRPDSNEEMDRDDKDRDDDDEDDDDDEEDEDEEDEGGGNYEIVASKPASVSAAE